MEINTIIFDLGGVLIDWNPRYLYRKIFSSEKEVEDFLNNVASFEWNEEQDGGRSLHEATELLVHTHPDYENEIRAFYHRWEEMLGGAIQETVIILEELYKNNNHKLLALSNWSGETFPIAKERFHFLQWFEGIIISGDEKMKKPDPRIYQLISTRYQCSPPCCLFIDDNLRNIEAAINFGFQAHHFKSPEKLYVHLMELKLL